MTCDDIQMMLTESKKFTDFHLNVLIQNVFGNVQTLWPMKSPMLSVFWYLNIAYNLWHLNIMFKAGSTI